MYPSPNFNPFESLQLKRSSSFPLPSHENPNFKSLFNFPSPFLDEHESPLNQIFLQNTSPNYSPDPTPAEIRINHHLPTGKSKVEEPETDPAPPPPLMRRRSQLGVVPRRRAGKKDRHSKICTAQGIRDRRMRLSLQVARKFFDLQDMLGYDKASKTIEWLFTQSKKAIKDLVDDHRSPAKTESSFLSECEDLSGIEEINSNVDVVPSVLENGRISTPPSIINPKRESREKARARARCRTREKMLVKCFQSSGNPNINNIGKIQDPEIRVSDQFEAAAAYNMMEHQLSDVGAIEKFLGNSSSDHHHHHCAAAAADYADPNSSGFMGFLGNWDVLSNDRGNCLQYSVTNQVAFAANARL